MIDNGIVPGAWADALKFPPWRQIAPDTFSNARSDGANRLTPPALSSSFRHGRGDSK